MPLAFSFLFLVSSIKNCWVYALTDLEEMTPTRRTLSWMTLLSDKHLGKRGIHWTQFESLTLGGGVFLGSSCPRLLRSHNPAGDLLNSSLQCVSQIPVPPPLFPRFRASICPRENCKVSLLQGMPSFPLQDALTLLKSALRPPPPPHCGPLSWPVGCPSPGLYLLPGFHSPLRQVPGTAGSAPVPWCRLMSTPVLRLSPLLCLSLSSYFFFS